MTAGLDDVLAGGYVATGVAVGAVVAVGRRWVEDVHSRLSQRHWQPVLLSLHACGWLYACTPDTELARLLLGIVVGLGAGALVLRQSWALPALAITAGIVVAAVLDGSPRDSAVVGGIGVAVVHAAAQRWLGGPRWATQLAIVVWATAVCSRSAGLGPGLARPILVASVALTVTAAVLVVLPRRDRAPSRAET